MSDGTDSAIITTIDLNHPKAGNKLEDAFVEHARLKDMSVTIQHSSSPQALQAVDYLTMWFQLASPRSDVKSKPLDQASTKPSDVHSIVLISRKNALESVH